MWHDLTRAVRTLRHHAGFTGLAIVVLALGIGLNTAIFAIVHALLLKPLPVSRSAELVSIYAISPQQPDRPRAVSAAIYESIERHEGLFSGITGHWDASYMMEVEGGTSTVNGEWVLSNYFDVLGVGVPVGRSLTPSDDDVSTTERAVVISHALWTKRFQGDPSVVGSRVRLALWGRPYVEAAIVGVAAPGFNGVSDPWKPTHVWTTFSQGGGGFPTRLPPTLAPIGRLAPGVTRGQAQAALVTMAKQAYEARGSVRPGAQPTLVAYATDDVRMPYDPAAAVIPTRLAAALTIVVIVVLLVAAANIAGILLARGIGRAREIAIQRVLGAGAIRIARQLLAESTVLAFLGAALGLALATWLVGAFNAITPMQFAFEVPLDWRVVSFAAGVGAAVGILVGVLPVRQALASDVSPWISGSSAVQTGSRASLRYSLTIPQVAFSVMLLIVAGVYVRAMLDVELSDLGYRHENVLVVNPVLRTETASVLALSSTADRERRAERARRFYRHTFERLRRLSAVADFAISDTLPLGAPPDQVSHLVVSRGGGGAASGDGLPAERAAVSPGYFQTLGLRLDNGRDFDERDDAGSRPVVVLSAGLARKLWPSSDAIGREVAMVAARGSSSESPPQWYEVVGLVSDVSPVLHEDATRPYVYFPLHQDWHPSVRHVLLRGTGDSRTLASAVRQAITGSDSLADVHRTQLMSEMLSAMLYPRRIAGVVLAVSASLALCLALLGVYGVVSYSAARRSAEMGVRMALGADRQTIVRLVLGESVRIAAGGSFVGIALGYAAIRVTSGTYLALPRLDPATLVMTPLLMCGVVALACYVPARRAARSDPMTVLRRS